MSWDYTHVSQLNFSEKKIGRQRVLRSGSCEFHVKVESRMTLDIGIILLDKKVLKI